MSEHKPIELRHARIDGARPELRPDVVASVDKVRSVLEALRFGSITLTVHDARVVQIDVTEKTRLTN
ncbi:MULTISPECIES: YezD family protein [Sphingobium]|uniref:DUF2292 domain-containing protein n=2 Tax=Sphingobium cupriresistens TaxID=1132417 RepID=A0A0J7Y0N0_9SPHN|nr:MULTISPECIES: YezD family protein [Sphingobium]KMS57342.1 hypothetical protein V473_03735 [Sphingobium cupriresistens LL01]MBJ7377551.1 YezD family protein [Sphingobium sp.]RYM14856.1 DUF2292 domain-containing protein [Sphingobium cupriresistens]